MAPDFVPEQTMEALRRAVLPSEADILAAKASVRARLDHAAATTSSLVAEVVADLGVPVSREMETYNIQPELEPEAAVDREAAPLKRQRLSQATRLALAELAAEGVIVPARTPNSDRIAIRIHRGGTTGSEHVPVSTPDLADAYRTKPGIESATSPPLLTSAEFASGLGELLTPRARECLEEALAAYRRGLYLSAVNLLGAVSEAAWYEIAARLQGTVPELAEPVDNNRTGEVQRLVAKAFVDNRGRARSMTNELVSHASYLRDLRNYGVHPRADQDPGQGHAFTETGCFVLIIESHRYLARLREAAELLGLDFSLTTNA